ncbi:MAG: hypothetical protein KDD78_10620, partial [Caldilineaceae bacterium]|nr:hypothetical protein [Caldilineaceae bacterium]
MVVSAFERLERILDLEEKQGWRNRAVIGGLVAMGERWAADALEETPPDGMDATQHAAVVSTVVALMTEYEGREPETRDQIANWIRRALTGDIPVEAGALVAQAGQVATAQTSAVSAAESSVPPASSSPAKRRDNADERGSAKRARKQGRDAESVDDGQFQDIDEDDDGRVVGNLRPAESTDVAQRRAAQRERTPRSNAVAQDLQAATTILTGVGATRAELLSRLGINQVGDLLWHLPNRYDDFSQMRTIDEMQPGEQVTVLA